MTIGRDGLSKPETVVVAAIERGVPSYRREKSSPLSKP